MSACGLEEAWRSKGQGRSGLALFILAASFRPDTAARKLGLAQSSAHVAHSNPVLNLSKQGWHAWFVLRQAQDGMGCARRGRSV
jgi:hypothetical protein